MRLRVEIGPVVFSLALIRCSSCQCSSGRPTLFNCTMTYIESASATSGHAAKSLVSMCFSALTLVVCAERAVADCEQAAFVLPMYLPFVEQSHSFIKECCRGRASRHECQHGPQTSQAFLFPTETDIECSINVTRCLDNLVMEDQGVCQQADQYRLCFEQGVKECTSSVGLTFLYGLVQIWSDFCQKRNMKSASPSQSADPVLGGTVLAVLHLLLSLRHVRLV